MVIISDVLYTDFNERRVIRKESTESYSECSTQIKKSSKYSGFPQGSNRVTIVSDFTWKAISMIRFSDLSEDKKKQYQDFKKEYERTQNR